MQRSRRDILVPRSRGEFFRFFFFLFLSYFPLFFSFFLTYFPYLCAEFQTPLLSKYCIMRVELGCKGAEDTSWYHGAEAGKEKLFAYAEAKRINKAIILFIFLLQIKKEKKRKRSEWKIIRCNYFLPYCEWKLIRIEIRSALVWFSCYYILWKICNSFLLISLLLYSPLFSTPSSFALWSYPQIYEWRIG